MASHWHAGSSLRQWVGAAGDAVVSVFFPGGCRLCERLLIRASRLPICEECLGSFPALPARVCAVCGSPALAASTLHGSAGEIGDDDGAGVEARTCLACRERKYRFECARSYAAYRGVLVRAVVLLKFERIEPLAAYFGDRLASIAKREGFIGDIVVPVPLHRVRERERGFNQAELIAREVAKRVGLPFKPVLLTRTKARPDKHILSNEERWRIVRGAFATRPGSQVDNKRVLLVDDVMTTGATLDACAKALLEAGARSVIGLTVARAVKRETPTGIGE
ncbi:MAG TPA: ComF family protein [Candidatus Acidoferrum sp.]|nr:ComF family protein [Candidatus Acidoferrum sp.]